MTNLVYLRLAFNNGMKSGAEDGIRKTADPRIKRTVRKLLIEVSRIAQVFQKSCSQSNHAWFYSPFHVNYDLYADLHFLIEI